MAIFRVEKTKGYTVMSNHHLKNRALSLRAKGLLSLMLSLPDDWSYTMKGLAVISLEGIDAIRQAIAELEKHGYVERTRVRDEKGCLRGTEYVVYEQPPAQAQDSTDGQTECEEPTQDKPVLENPILDNPTLDIPTLENPMQDSPTLGNPTQLNTNVRKTNPSSTNPTKERAAANPNQSNPNQSYRPTEGVRDGMRMGWDEMGLAAAASLRESVLDQISYEALLHNRAIGKSRLDEVVDIMVARGAALRIISSDEILYEDGNLHGQWALHYSDTDLDKNQPITRNTGTIFITSDLGGIYHRESSLFIARFIQE